MAKFKLKFKLSKSWKKVITIGLSVILAIGTISGLSLIAKNAEKNTKTVSPVYTVGGLDNKGKYVDRDDCIYTKEAFECQGLKITPDFDADVSYQIFYYGKNDKYLGSTEILTDFHEASIPLAAIYARIMIIPNTDDVISWYEVGKYADDLTLEISKKQVKNDFVVIDYEVFGTDKAFHHAGLNTVGTEFVGPQDYEGYDIIKFDVSNLNSFRIVTAEEHEGLRVLMVDKDNIVVYSDAYSIDTVTVVDVYSNAVTCSMSIKQGVEYLISK